MRCLWLSGDVPYPSTSGRRAYSAGLSESVAATGIDVIGLGQVDPETDSSDRLVDWRGVGSTTRTRAARRLLSRWPAMSVDRRTASYRHGLQRVLESEAVDVVVVDHLQMAWTLDVLDHLNLPIAYVSHNHETAVRRKVATSHPWTSPRRHLLRYDAERAARAERRVVRSADVVTAITESDAAAYRAAGAEHVVVLPPGYNGKRCVARTIDEHVPREATMVTNLDWHVKQANLRRFLAVADKRFASAGVTLKIIGPAPAAFVDDVAPGLLATEFAGQVASIESELENARVGIVFEPEGGGFKLKALDYVFCRTPMAVLDGSVEGLPLEPGRDYLSFENVDALTTGVIDLVNDVERCQSLQVRAFGRCDGAFDWSDRGGTLAPHLSAGVSR